MVDKLPRLSGKELIKIISKVGFKAIKQIKLTKEEFLNLL